MYSNPEVHLSILQEELSRVQQRNRNLIRENILFREAAVAADTRLAAEISQQLAIVETMENDRARLIEVVRRLRGEKVRQNEEIRRLGVDPSILKRSREDDERPPRWVVWRLGWCFYF